MDGADDWTGTFDMGAEVDTDLSMMNFLLDVLNVAALKTIDCNDVDYQDCTSPSGIGPPSCTDHTMSVFSS